jgi:hypothetical protein
LAYPARRHHGSPHFNNSRSRDEHFEKSQARRIRGSRRGAGRNRGIGGARYGQPSVTVVKNADGTGWAYGTLGGTRNSAFPGERLSCSIGRAVTLNTTGGEVKVTTVICVAVDKNGVSATCLSTKEEFADALNGLSNDGLIDFRFTGARCDSIAVYESSSLERKR